MLQKGRVWIRIKACGLNRSELFTRRGLSPDVKFSRVLGIEAVELVEDAPGEEFHKSDVVATAMGGLGRQFDGGYAEFTCVPITQVQVVRTSLPWEKLGAVPAAALAKNHGAFIAATTRTTDREELLPCQWGRSRVHCQRVAGEISRRDLKRF